jgi:restriction system protein
LVIPTYEQLLLPLLKFSSDKKEHSSKEPIEDLSKIFDLSEEEKSRLLPSRKTTIFYSRLGWAQTYLKQAGLLTSTKRGFFKITDRGLQILKQHPKDIDLQFLYQFPEFVDFINRSKKDKESEDESHLSKEEMTPEENMETSYEIIQEKFKDELLSTIKKSTPKFFEKLVVDLLVSMGYGGSIKEAGKAIGMSGDEGVDGIIKEDLLGLDLIFIQAKKWEGTIGRPEIQKFAGALQGQRARKGIFLTTGVFSQDAIDYVSKIDSKIILIDGKKLAEYMIDHGVGVSADRSYVIKKINTDYFESII